MRVALVAANLAPRYGGPATAEFFYAQALSLAGVDVRLVTTDQDGTGRLDVPLCRPVRGDNAFETWYYPAGVGSQKRPWSWSFAAGIREATVWADVVRVNSLYMPHNVYVYRACRLSETPYVVRPHGTLEPYQRLSSPALKQLYDKGFGDQYLRSASAVHFTSSSEAEHARDLVPPEKAFVVPIPVEAAPDPTSVARNRDVLFLGRVAAKKRIDLLLTAWQLIAPLYPESRLVIAGPVDADQASVVDRATVLPRVILKGPVSGRAKEQVLSSAAVFVLPSENENFGVAVAEAMGHGIPVVISPEVALAGEVLRADAGLVVPRDAHQVAEAISRLLDGPSIRERLGGNGHRLVAQEFSPRAVGTRLAEELRRVASGFRGKSRTGGWNRASAVRPGEPDDTLRRAAASSEELCGGPGSAGVRGAGGVHHSGRPAPVEPADWAAPDAACG
jgi:glycosyltransferase involved in cell wall biosynthesis